LPNILNRDLFARDIIVDGEFTQIFQVKLITGLSILMHMDASIGISARRCQGKIIGKENRKEWQEWEIPRLYKYDRVFA
jgi:hypothetical protein